MPAKPSMTTPPSLGEDYFHRARRPLASLIFLLPFLLVYEAGVWWHSTHAQGSTTHILARSLLADVLEVFGAGGVFLPGLAVVVVLLCWHIAARHKWRFEPGLYFGMAVESIALAIPLLVLAMIWGAHKSQAADAIAPPGWTAELVFDIGAGVYEELFFRLMIIALAHLLLVDMLGVADQQGTVLAVVLSAGLFSAYHFFGVDTQGNPNPLSLPRVVFYFMAGVYFAVIYLLRGFGVVAATHAFYDIDITLLRLGLLPVAQPEG